MECGWSKLSTKNGVCKQIKDLPNWNCWINRKVHFLLKARDHIFQAKHINQQKIEKHFISFDPCHMQYGMQSITDFKQLRRSPIQLVSDYKNIYQKLPRQGNKHHQESIPSKYPQSFTVLLSSRHYRHSHTIRLRKSFFPSTAILLSLSLQL